MGSFKKIIFSSMMVFMILSGGTGVGDNKQPPILIGGGLAIYVPAYSSLPPKVLILYDTAGEYGYLGKEYALLLENLLGHFKANVTSKPTASYKTGELGTFDTVFYLGSSYLKDIDIEAGYNDFFHDAAIFDTTVVWINYNLWNLEQAWSSKHWNNMSFEEATGFRFEEVSTDIPYNRVEYKDTELFKGIIPFATPGSDVSHCVEDENNNSYACSTELIVVEQNMTTNRSTTYAWAYTTLDKDPAREPYIVHGGHFWFVGDMPFSYMYEEDRYLAFADLLHDMLEVYHEENHLALMRLEDVNAVDTDICGLNEVVNYMEVRNIPFTIAAIPLYRDPLDHDDDNITERKLSVSTAGDIVRGLYERGSATVVQHGYTHQLDDLKNPYNGVTADDFEFMRVTDKNSDGIYIYEGPSHDDNTTWAKERMNAGKSILKEMGITAFAWEAPHYMAGPAQYRAIREIYPVQYARLIYYPWENGGWPGHTYDYVGQYFPYLIHRDVYGYTLIPENIQNIAYDPNPGYRTLTSEDTIRFARKLKVVRDGIGSFFYHPYLGKEELDRIINGLQNLGYTFVSAPSLLKK